VKSGANPSFRWSVQRLPSYPQDKARAEEEYWMQRDIGRMNNRTDAMLADRSAGGWWVGLSLHSRVSRLLHGPY
jgi:hypothetical protein